MDANVTVGVRGLLVTGLALLAVAVAYLVGGARDAPAAAAAEPETAPRVVTMSGTGTARAVPDQLGFTVSVGATRPDLDAALEVANDTMARAFRALTEQGVARRDVQTSGLSMEPVYDYPANLPPVLRGYRVTQESQVLVRELASGGAAIGAVVATAGNSARIGDIELHVGDPDAALAKARTAAAEEASAKAEEYAEATGQSLGAVRTLRELDPPATESEHGLSQAYDTTAALRSAMPIRAGREELSVRLEVVWELR